MAAESPPLIVVVGQTASGKSALAMELARRFNGEIISADARTVYTGMDIGTAKPSRQDRQEIRHHLLDVATPDQRFTAADFKQLALRTIEEIAGRGKVPIMCGGTGLYIDAVLYDFDFSNSTVRDEQNPRHAKPGQAGRRQPLRPDTLILGLEVPQETLEARIGDRIEAMLQAGLQGEVEGLAGQYGWEAPGLNAIGYREWHEQEGPEPEIVAAEIIKNTRQYAKRQKTWFKRNKDVQWLANKSQALQLCNVFLKQV